MIANQIINLVMTLAGAGTILYILVGLCEKNRELSIRNSCFYLVKAIGYGLLALYIYVSYPNKSEMDMLTLFSFVLAFLEAVHNLLISLGEWIILVLKLMFHK